MAILKKQPVEIKIPRECFNEVYLDNVIGVPARYVVLMGGAGSGKSVFCAQKILFWDMLQREQKERVLLVRKVARTIRRSQYQLIRDLALQYKMGHLFDFRDSYLTINVPDTENELMSAGIDDPEKIKSIAGITKVWIEEATELTREDFVQLDLRLRGETTTPYQIYLSFNPIDQHHWLNDMFFINKKPGALVLRTTYRDNKFLDPYYRSILEGITDTNMRQVYLEGKWGVLQNAIYPHWTVTNDWRPDRYDEIIYGLDFGYTNPTALIGVGLKEGGAVIREGIYKRGLTNQDLINEMDRLKIKKHIIYCDNDPTRIEELRRAGYKVRPADKDVHNGIDFVKTLNIEIHANAVNVLKERQSYQWETDRNGNLIDGKPVKYNDHTMDAIRYALFTHLRKRRRPGVFGIKQPNPRRLIEF